MKYLLVITAVALAMCMCNSAKADPSILNSSNERWHFTEHFVASGLIYTGVYTAMHDGLKAPKWTSFAFGAFTSGTIGLAYKGTEGFPKDTGRKMIYNGAGIVAGAGLCWAFDL
jgi:hypothetical protein